MADSVESLRVDNEARLKKRLRDIRRRSHKFANAVETLTEWARIGWRPVLFGGFVRDLYVLGSRKYPRDVDVVVSNKTNEEIEFHIHTQIKRRTSMGGFHLQMGLWNFDVWGLDSTWAYKKHPEVFHELKDLPKTTFLDVEAIAIEILDTGKLGAVYQNGFFAAIEARRIDLNWEETQNSSLAAVRALAIALKLNFTIGRRLAKYILGVADSEGIDALIDAQLRHYGATRLDASAIETILEHVRAALGSNDQSITLGLTEAEQLRLWPELLRA